MEEIKLVGVDEVLFHETLENGLNVYMLVNEHVNNFYMTLSVRYGSIDTEYSVDGGESFKRVHNGIAHFLEHVNFNEGKDKTAHDYFNNLGSSINAFTTFDFTSYEVFASSYFKENLNHLLDYVQTPYFTKGLVEKEKGIIVEEVKMGKNSPGHKLYYGMNKALYKKDKRKYLVTGEVSDVKAITVDELKDVYKTFYHPKNMFLVITGNFSPEEAIEIVKKNQGEKKFSKFLNPIRKEIKEPVSVKEKEVEIEGNVEIPKVKISYKMPKEIFGDIETHILNIYLSIILRNNFGATSILRDELFRKEKLTSLNAFAEIFKDVVTINLTAETNDIPLIVNILKDKMKNLELNEEQIQRRKRANIAALINDYDDIEYVNSDICDQLISINKIVDNFYNIFNSMNLEKGQEIMKNISLDNCSIVKMVPYKQ